MKRPLVTVYWIYFFPDFPPPLYWLNYRHKECEYVDNVSIRDETECLKAYTTLLTDYEIDHSAKIQTINNGNMPKGCTAKLTTKNIFPNIPRLDWNTTTYNIYFNEHPKGRNNDKHRYICKGDP